MGKLSDLSPVATPAEVKRAIQVSKQRKPFSSAAELSEHLHDLIVIERSERAAIVARMMSDA